MMYLYFVSSSQVPVILPNYEQQLKTKEQAMHQYLKDTDSSPTNKMHSEQIYQWLNRNEICLHNFAAVKERQQAILRQAQNKFLINGQLLASLYLENANLNREMNKFELAKTSYDKSLQILNKNAFSSSFALTDFQTESINYNNQATLYFLLAQKTANIEQKQKYFQLAKDYLIRAKHLISVAGSNGNKCFQENVDENLKQCLDELRFCQQPQ